MNYMLTGQLPTDKLYKKRLKMVIKRCVELNPKDRFQTVSALLKELKHYKPRYNPYRPPGFRSMNVFKMIIACLGYVCVISFLCMFDDAVAVLIYGIGILLTIMFYSNYLNVKNHFPFMSSNLMAVRIIGYIINPLIINGFVLFVFALIHTFLVL